MDKLQTQVNSLKLELDKVQRELDEVTAQLSDKQAKRTVDAHIRALHEYNEIRDIGQRKDSR